MDLDLTDEETAALQPMTLANGARACQQCGSREIGMVVTGTQRRPGA
jgi:hypothetical protein